jgi:hypothetical protein
MTKIEITDAMVERAKIVLVDGGLLSHGETVESHARRILSAALNPPPEPEITVTKEMLVAGACAYNGFLMMNQPIKRDDLASVGGVSAAYRAMRALEPKPERPVWTKVDQPPERGPGYRFHARSHDVGYPHSHRRAGDPK